MLLCDNGLVETSFGCLNTALDDQPVLPGPVILVRACKESPLLCVVFYELSKLVQVFFVCVRLPSLGILESCQRVDDDNVRLLCNATKGKIPFACVGREA